ncbi:hypothetical protein M3Y97_00620300 [Aphelenchoides bicaudatus]|nr:hypothetical protein M3Y97_00620300 [Aphelenchoides bicaudatus]
MLRPFAFVPLLLVCVSFAHVVKRAARTNKCPAGDPAAFLCNQKTKKCEVSKTRECTKRNDGRLYCCKPTQNSPKQVDLHAFEDKLRRIRSSSITKRQQPECKDRAADCSRLKPMCTEADAKSVMLQECAKTCGFCKTGSGSSGTARLIPRVFQEDASTTTVNPTTVTGGSTGSADCKDKITNCDDVEDLCHDEPFDPSTVPTGETESTTTEPGTDETESTGETETTREPGGRCVDKLKSCRIWVKYGFCNTSKIAWKKKKELCQRSCKWCGR